MDSQIVYIIVEKGFKLKFNQNTSILMYIIIMFLPFIILVAI